MIRNSLRQDVLQASARISDSVRYTPLVRSIGLSERLQANVFLKLENVQYTGSFKVRGAFNKLRLLDDVAAAQGVVAASSGNHGTAVAYAGRQLGIQATIFVPHNVVQNKVDAICNFGGKVIYHGDDCSDSEIFARDYAEKNNLTFISPYNDYEVICGQGTIAYEIDQQLPQVDALFVTIGGGGLISGISGYYKQGATSPQIIGCLPEASPCMYACMQAGEVVQIPCQPTLSDGSAGNIEPGSITLDYSRQYVDDCICVSETAIADALRYMLEKEHLLVEGAAAVPVAALLAQQQQWTGKTVVLVLCGANISLSLLQSIIN